MFARKIRVWYEEGGRRQACPLKWLDSFSMRNFTNDQVFDDTIPAGDGEMEIGTRVPLDRLRTSMEDWFRRKSYLPKEATLLVEERALLAGSQLPVASGGTD
jgi:hypothetical protein